jgi:hypothetical protein
MSAIAKPMAASTLASNTNPSILVEQVKDVTSLTVPAIANYGPKYLLVFTLMDNTQVQLSYASSANQATALAAYKAAFSTNF